MAKFLLTYHGGGMPDSPEEGEKIMQAWTAWFGDLGSAVIDMGAPCGAAKTVGPDGSATDGGGANPATGYSLLDAIDLDDAVAKAKGCPVLASGGSVEVSETIAM